MQFLFLFCADPLAPKLPDSIYLPEAEVVKKLGIHYELIDYEQLISNHEQANLAINKIKPQDNVVGIYRGWMLAPEKYAALFTALQNKGIHLINNTSQYNHCHLFPNAYHLIQQHTPKSIWVAADEIENTNLMDILQIFGNQPIIIKDYVKSQKHRWEEACYIPSAANKTTVEKVVKRFIELQGENLTGGIVFRAFIEFEKIGKHQKSKMPLIKEYRVFFLYGEPINISSYWETENNQESLILPEHLLKIGKSIESNFFTMDIAKQNDGKLIIVELGDGQVAGLPEAVNIDNFYQLLIDRVENHQSA